MPIMPPMPIIPGIYLAYISPISRLYLAYISPISRLYLRLQRGLAPHGERWRRELRRREGRHRTAGVRARVGRPPIARGEDEGGQLGHLVARRQRALAVGIHARQERQRLGMRARGRRTQRKPYPYPYPYPYP